MAGFTGNTEFHTYLAVTLARFKHPDRDNIEVRHNDISLFALSFVPVPQGYIKEFQECGHLNCFCLWNIEIIFVL
jgi:hypothetical protein